MGRWGPHLLRNLLALPAAAVVAVVEPSRDRHAAIRQTFGETAAFELATDIESVLSRADIDAVAIATPAATHYNLVKAALLADKHVLVEKPFALTVAGCEELCAIAAQRRRQLVVDHIYLFHPAVQAGEAVLSAKPLGTLRYGYAARTHLGPVRRDVNVLWDLAVHDLAIFNCWLGASPVAVAAQGQTWLTPQADFGNELEMPPVDGAWLQLFYPNGLQTTLHVSWANPDKQRRLSLVGDRGVLIFDEMQPHAPLTMYRGAVACQGGKFTLQPDGDRQIIPVLADEPLRRVCQHFISCVQQQRPSSLSSGQVGTQFVQILAALTRSLRQGNGQRVNVDEV